MKKNYTFVPTLLILLFTSVINAQHNFEFAINLIEPLNCDGKNSPAQISIAIFNGSGPYNAQVAKLSDNIFMPLTLVPISNNDVFTADIYLNGDIRIFIQDDNLNDFIQDINLQPINIDNSVIVNGSTITANFTNGTYSWFRCSDNQQIPNEINRSFSPKDDSEYRVTIIDQDTGCTVDSECNSIDQSTLSLPNINNDDLINFNIYPNPSKDFIRITENLKIDTYTIYNIMGRVIKESNKPTELIYIGDLEIGQYYIKLTSSGRVNVQKILKI